MLTFRFSGADGVMTIAEKLTSGMVGKQVKFEFTSDWENLTKTAVFEAGDISIAVNDVGDTATIPEAVLTIPRRRLKIGIYGEGTDGKITPTIYANGPIIEKGADPWNAAAGNPPMPKWKELEERIEDLENGFTGGSAGEGGANPPVVKETDPTVPEWAKQPQKPVYTAQEVGALPATYTPPDQTAEQVGADPKGTAASAVSQHNTSADSHGDLRLELKALADRLAAFLDSDDTTLDQLSELIATINSNKSLIEAVTTGKVSTTDIIDNLTTNVPNKPLSAAQGVALKGLIDSLSANLSKYALTSAVPTKVSQLQNDAGYLTEAAMKTYVDEAILGGAW